MMLGVNYVIDGCFSVRLTQSEVATTIPELNTEVKENIVAVIITQSR